MKEDQDTILRVVRFGLGTLRRKPDQIKYAWRYLKSYSSLLGGNGWDPLALGEPWICYSMRDWLQENLTSSTNVFEYGSGGSTIFFAQRVASVHSVEHDRGWFDSVKLRIKQLQLGNVVLKHVPPDKGLGSGRALSHRLEYTGLNFDRYVNAIATIPDGHLDLVFIDGRCRSACIAPSKEKLRVGGWLIVDDVKREDIEHVSQKLKDSGWKCYKFEGLKPMYRTWGCAYVFEKS